MEACAGPRCGGAGCPVVTPRGGLELGRDGLAGSAAAPQTLHGNDIQSQNARGSQELAHRRHHVEGYRRSDRVTDRDRRRCGVLMPGAGQPLEPPPRPSLESDMHDFAYWMRRLREWSGLKLAALRLPPASSSVYLRGERFPPSKFVDAFVTRCLEHGAPHCHYAIDINTELRCWQTAWAHVEHQQLKQSLNAPRKILVMKNTDVKDIVPHELSSITSVMPVKSAIYNNKVHLSTSISVSLHFMVDMPKDSEWNNQCAEISIIASQVYMNVSDLINKFISTARETSIDRNNVVQLDSRDSLRRGKQGCLSLNPMTDFE